MRNLPGNYRNGGRNRGIFCTFLILGLSATLLAVPLTANAEKSYDDYETPETCGECHAAFYTQWQEAMMSQSYTHKWDEIEYFKLALPHAEKDPKVAEVKAGCNGCHAPLAFYAGDIPPQPPEAGTRANEGVSCDVCHTITGFEGEIPHNFNFISEPGEKKYGPRKDVESGGHEVAYSEFLSTPEFCGTCHNEQDPYGIWVKSTHLEWKAGPYAAEGIRCQDCHMTTTKMQTATDGNTYDDARLHLFHGAHDDGKVRGTIELRIYPESKTVKAGETVDFDIALFNQKAGHKFPTGSVEDRIVWMHVEAIDAAGKHYQIPVVPKGFEGEEYTIGSEELAYQDMGIGLNDDEFMGVQRDGIPVGDRIFRMAYFDPQGRMTIQQWNTASLGVDYRIGPRETKMEKYSFTAPADIAPGPLKVNAVLYYQKLVKPVADFLGVPPEESRAVVVNDQSVTITAES